MNELAIAEHLHPVRVVCRLGVMGGKQDCHASFAAYLTQQRKHLGSALRIEASCRLISENQTWVCRERPCDHYSLPLTHRELLGAMLNPLSQSESPKQRHHPRLSLSRTEATEQLQRSIVARADARNQIQGLADKSQLKPAIASRLAYR